MLKRQIYQAQTIGLTLLFFLVTTVLYSQSPLGIPYQAVMRNADGTVLSNAAVNMMFKIHDGTASGSVVYEESHALTSNAQGLVACVVGNGVVSHGNFSNIQWGSGAKFLHVLMGTTDLGTQQMMSVPYALYSNGVDVRVSSVGDTLVIGGQSVIVPGISAANVSNTAIPTSGLGAVVLPGNATCADQFISVSGCNGQTSLTYDGRIYDLVEIGGQCWFADNLATDQYRNGDLIQTGLDVSSWSGTNEGAFAIYNNSVSFDSIYGKLYNGFAVMDSRNLCPAGWRVPTDCDWMFLENFIGVSNSEIESWSDSFRGASILADNSLKSASSWYLEVNPGQDLFGFNALPGGIINDGGTSNNLYWQAYFWTSSNCGNNTVLRKLESGLNNIERSCYYDGNHYGMSVRCIKENSQSQTFGCTDASACNFLVNANHDDGSCRYVNATCDDGNVSTVNDVIGSDCQCAGTLISAGGLGSQVLPGNTTCANEYISVTGCGGQTSLTYNGRNYDLVEIGGQCWFADNLATDQYRNGDLIPTGLDNATWQSISAGAYTIYNNDPANDVTYGKLYNWYTTVDTRGLCPTGWHVPTDCEWMYLEGSLGMSVGNQESIDYRGTTEGLALKATSNWFSPNGNVNSSGFTALPGGFRDYVGVSFGLGYYGGWWSRTENDFFSAWYRSLNFSYSNVFRGNYYKNSGNSVRCLKD